MTIEVEIGVPLPEKFRTRSSKYPFGTMPVDGSFVVPGDLKNPDQTAAHARKRHKPKLFKYGIDDKGNRRIWRTA